MKIQYNKDSKKIRKEMKVEKLAKVCENAIAE